MNSQAVLLPKQSPAQGQLVDLTLRACATAREAVSHALDSLINGSPRALAAVRKCEEQLDCMDREMDERMAVVITQVDPEQARELLACMKIMLDVERVGDLVLSFAERAAIVRHRIDMEDVDQLTRIGCLLENMLAAMSRAFSSRDVEQAIHVLRTDSEIDRMRNLITVRHTENADGLKGPESLHVLSMANALERAGDHIKNMAEELCHLATGHTMRHVIRSKDKPIEQLFIDWLKQSSSSQDNPAKPGR
ncbi:MAG TPA: PhoU domain-containing protein [Candidatus Angelobacter sp.]|nr:PhoU domain-containing protein [Candidatus Angelobacter sp.]